MSKFNFEWNVFTDDFNGKKIVEHNVFKHSGFMKDLIKAKKGFYKNRKYDYKSAYDEFCEDVRRSLLYYYWAKCEWEVIITSWPQREECDRKVDVYSQVMMNWDRFIAYIMSNIKHIPNKF